MNELHEAKAFPDVNEPHETAVRALPRLAKIREALLSAPYEICTQKAELSTRYLTKHSGLSPLRRAFERLHYGAYARSVGGLSRGDDPSPWQVRFQNLLMATYRAADRRKPNPSLAYAEAFAYQLEHGTLQIYGDELIVGNPSSKRIGAPIHPDFGGLMMLPELDTLSERSLNPIRLTGAQRDELRKRVFPFWFSRSVLAYSPLYARGGDWMRRVNEGRDFIVTQFAGISHLTPDYPAVLRLGFRGIERQLEKDQGEDSADAKNAHDAKTVAFYRASLVAVRASIAFGHRWRRTLLQAAQREHDAARSQELLELAAVFERVPEHPAKTFHEALQCVLTTHVLVHQESFQHGVSFGRLDQILYPYYAADLRAARITRERAVELIGCFLAKAAELLPLFFERASEYFSGLSSASGITLGGRNPDGTDAVNELSHLFLQAYDQMRLRQPNLHVRVHPASDPEFMRLCYRVLSKGGGMPAFFNDEQVTAALEREGVPPDDSADYSIVGCAEWGVPHRSFPAAGAGFINLPAVLHDALKEETSRLGNIDEVLTAFRTRLRGTLAHATDANNAIETAHARHRPTPFLSTIVGGCIERRLDVTAGGADYNSTGFQGVGLADVADSLAAIEQLVFRDGNTTLSKLVNDVASDFASAPKLRGRLRNRLPKFGEDEGRGAHFVGVVAEIFRDELRNFRNPRGGRYLAGFWSMTTHQGFGGRTPSLPSGRLAGEALANGASPSTGCERGGPTASLVSAAHVPATGNGCVVNQRLGSEVASGPAGEALLDGLLRGYFRLGGAQVQFSVLDTAALIDAKKNPHKYRDLVVRISGYSAYFNDLSPEMKDELIQRASCGEA